MNRGALALILVIVGALALPGLEDPLANGDEAIAADMVRTMHERGDYGDLRYHDAVLIQRPVWPLTAIAGVAAVVPGEVGLRLLPALCAWLTLVLLAVVLLRRHGVLPAFAAVLVVAAAPTWHIYTRVVSADSLLTLVCTVALVAVLLSIERPAFLPWAGAALGGMFAVKSLAALVPLAALSPGVLLVMWRHRQAEKRRLALGVVAFLATALPFFVVSYLQHGARFIDEHLGEAIVRRAQGDLAGVGMPGRDAYLVQLWHGDGPAVSLVLLAGVLAAGVLGLRRRDPWLWLPALAAGLMLLGFSAVGTRLPHYLLPIYPAAALAIGGLVGQLREVKLAPVLVGVAAVTLYANGVSRPRYEEASVPSPEARQLAALAPPGHARIYTFEWYAPALGYYAHRPWQILTPSAHAIRIFDNMDIGKASRLAARVPPWPEGRFLLVVDEADRPRLGDLRLIELGRARDWSLVEAEAR